MQIPATDQFYDAVMGAIEPELTLEQLPLLQEKFAKDSPGEKERRIERYQRALGQYDQRLQEYERTMQDALRHYAQYVEEMTQAADQHSADASLGSTPSASV